MVKRTEAWHDKKWLMPTLGVLALVSSPFAQDIRGAAIKGLGLVSPDWLFDFLLTGGVIGLAILLMLKSDRAARACEDLREQVQGDLASHRTKMRENLSKHRKQLQEDLPASVDPKLKQITDSIATLESHVTALGSRVGALESRVVALKEAVERSRSTT